MNNGVHCYHPEFLLDLTRAMFRARDGAGKLDADEHDALEDVDDYLKRAS